MSAATIIEGEDALSNDPGNKGSNFFRCGAIRFPHIEMFSFLRRKCINLQKGSLRKKMYLNSTFKGCIFVLKHLDQSQELQIHNFTRSAHTTSMLLRLRRDFVIRKLDRKKGINIYAALRNLMFKPIRTMVETKLKLAPSCIPTCSLRFGPFLLIWTIS